MLIAIVVNNCRLRDLRILIASPMEATRRANDANFGRMGKGFRRLEERIYGSAAIGTITSAANPRDFGFAAKVHF